MKYFRFLSVSLILIVLLSLLYFAVFKDGIVHADTTHVVISQIQIGATGKANQEFVELYNPTMNTVDLSGWRVGRSSSNSATVNNLVASLSASMPPHTYFLIAHPDATVAADMFYSSSSSAITANNTIYLFSDAGKTVIDEVGMGTAVAKESNDAPNPGSDQSILRKASATSTAGDLLPGGSQEHDGNGYDSDNNATDFVLLSSSMPRNSHTPAAPPLITPTPSTGSGSPTPTQTQTPTPSIVLTQTPTLTPTNPPASGTPTSIPTQIPTLTPTFSPSPLPTATPTLVPTSSPTVTPSPVLTDTPTPTIIPSATPTPSAGSGSSTPTPTFTPTPTPTMAPTSTVTPVATMTKIPTPTLPNHKDHPDLRFACSWQTKQFVIGWMHFSLPWFHCTRRDRF